MACTCRLYLVTVAVGLVTLLHFTRADVDSSNETNSMTGPPEVACTQDGVAFTMETEKPFHGQLYVKDEYHNPKCRINFKGVHKPGATFHLTFNECGMRRQRVLNPRGMMYSMTMMVQFHDVFVTQGDRAYQIRCFYNEQQTNLTNSLDVSPLTTQVMEATFPTPTCTYSIRAKSMDGPFASVVKVGDPILHIFSCNFAVDMYRILIKDCFVDDGKSQRQRIIGPDGCSTDETIMQTPQYHNEKLEAFGESTAFKWPDESVVYFSCQITLCMNEGHACEDVSPPKCNGKKSARKKRFAKAAPPNNLEFDLEVKKLTVVENDALRANAAANKKSHGVPKGGHFSKNTSLLDDYMALLHRNATSETHGSTHRSAYSEITTAQPEDSPSSEFVFPNHKHLKFEEIHRPPQACFGFETVAAFCILFTLFVAVLTLITCKLCLPCCADGEPRPTPANRSRRKGGFYHSGCDNSEFSSRLGVGGASRHGDSGGSVAEADFDDLAIVSYQQPIYTSVSLSAKQLLFSKLNLEV